MTFQQTNRTGLRIAQFLLYLVGLCLGMTAFAEQSETIRGLIKPQSQAVISSEIAAKIVNLPFRRGDAFDKDATLVEFDCALYHAHLDAALASLDSRTKAYQNATELLSFKASSPMEVELARSEMKQAEAKVRIERLRVGGCTIKAPYSGRVIEVLTNEYESVAIQTELLSVLSDEQLEIELIVPSRWLRWLETGATFSFHVDETDRTYLAEVARIGATVDPMSQTVQIMGVFEEFDQSILSGMSGSAVFREAP